MHQFLDQLLNPPVTSVKRRSHTDVNITEITKKSSQQDNNNKRLQEDLMNRKDSHPYFKQQEDEEEQAEEITEQIVFERNSEEGNLYRGKGVLPTYSNGPRGRFQGGEDELDNGHQPSSRQQQFEQYSHQPVEQVFQINSDLKQQLGLSYPSSYDEGQQQFAFQRPQQLIQQKDGMSMPYNTAPFIMPSFNNNSNENGGKAISLKFVEGLINGINSAKETQMELVRFLMGQKREFGVFNQEIARQIQLKIHQQMVRSAEHQRKQLQASIRQQLLTQYAEKSRINQNEPSSLLSQNPSTPHQSSLSNQRKWQIQKKLIKQQLEQRYQYRIEKLEQQVQEQRKYSQQLITAYQNQQKSEHTNFRASQSSNVESGNFQKDYNQKEILQQVEFLKRQLQEKDSVIAELEMEMEKMNEHIFDVEQKVEGIELEVETRVRDRVKEIENQHSLSGVHNGAYSSASNSPQKQHLELNPILQASQSHLQQSSKIFGFQPNNLLSQHTHQNPRFQQLVRENALLKRQLQQLQHQTIALGTHLKEQQTIILFREEQVKKNEEDISYEWAEVEREREVLGNRELELTTAEENISRKISELRGKEAELEGLEKELRKREIAINFKEEEIQRQLEEMQRQLEVVADRENALKYESEQFHHEKRQQQHKHDHQSIEQNHSTSLQQPNTMSRKNIKDFNVQGGGSFRQPIINIPQLPIGRKHLQQQQYDLPNKQERSFDTSNEIIERNRQGNGIRHDVIMVKNGGSFERSYEELDRSYGQRNAHNVTGNNRERERMVITSTNFRSNRPSINTNVHQYVLPQTSKAAHHHAHNSRSKSRSNQKSSILRSNFTPTSGSLATGFKTSSSFSKGKYGEEYYHSKPQGNLDGLGSKLERLRDQIKREIDSIK